MHKLSFAVIANRNQTFSIHHYTPREVSAKQQNVLHSHICTSCVCNFKCTQCIEYFRNPATDEIHVDDGNHGLA